MSQRNIRNLICDAVAEILEDGAYSGAVLSGAFNKYDTMSRSERAFFTKVTIGTVEMALYLDALIDLVSQTKVRKMKPQVRTILRMSVYQMLYLDRTPDPAVCNEAVKIAKKRGLFGLSGFVNGVLRTISRDKEKLVEQLAVSAPPNVPVSMPEPVFHLFEQQYGRDRARTICTSFLSDSPVYLRTETSRVGKSHLKKMLAAEHIDVSEIGEHLPKESGIFSHPAMFDYALCAKGALPLSSLATFEGGLFYVQDLSSMAACEAAIDGLAKDAPLSVIDVCASPGGKSLLIADRLPKAEVFACDISKEKLSRIKENIRRLKAERVSVRLRDASKPDPSEAGRYGLVICDLPCSGLGVLRRRPEIKYRITERQIAELAALQEKILDASAPLVCPGGRLSYSTCTISRRENEEQADAFLTRHPQFERIFQRQLLPDADGCDGFFNAVFVRRG